MATTCRSRLFVGAKAVKSLQVIIKMNINKIKMNINKIKMNKNKITKLGGSYMYIKPITI